jgi:hypothetical protein
LSESRINRVRQQAIDNLISRIPSSPPDGARSLLVQTTTKTTYPTTAGAYYAVKAVDVDGAETEGATPTFTVQTDIFYALNVGSAVPPSGTNILAECIGGMWLIRFD